MVWFSIAPSRDAPPAFDAVRAAYRASDALLLDRHGVPLHQLRVDHTKRQLAWTPLANISPAAIRVILTSEDQRFWQHAGVDWWTVAGAAWDRLRQKSHRGASTLTMQLASLLDSKLRPTSDHRSWPQKWSQMRAAWAIEQDWSKDKILEAYLNLVSFRGELQGIHAASRSLFDKQPSGLETSEALLLAVLLRAPNTTAKKAAKRACALAKRHSPEINCPQLRELSTRLLLGGLPPIRSQAAWAPHVAQRLLGREKLRTIPSRQAVSTLDEPLQRFVIASLGHQLNQLANKNVRDGIALVTDNATGQILAYVGNGGNHEPTRFVDGIQAYRQPGSTLKPFLYALAIEQRLLTAASLLEDAPMEIVTPSGLYVPQNYDRAFKGWVSARTALASSLNIPAIRTLRLTGVEPFVDRLRQLGFSQMTEEGSFYGYALALGSATVTLWQQVGAYRALANGGIFTPLILRLDEKPEPAIRVMDESAAFIVADILSDPSARSLTFRLDNPLNTPFWSAVKTGTSKQMRDSWCIGFSQHYTVGVWVGNFEGQPTYEVSGVTGAAPVWLEIMTFLHQDRHDTPPSPPTGVTMVETHFHPPLEHPRKEWFLAGSEMPSVTLNRAVVPPPPRILYPLNGAILAMDPDIPPERQRLFFRMNPETPLLHWRLDEQPLANTKKGWFPTRGRHQLALATDDGSIVDHVHFQVRGSTIKKQ